MIRTDELFTLGIVNLPILRDSNNKPVMDVDKAGKIVPKTDGSYRYLFFELDNDDFFKQYNPNMTFLEAFEKVKDVYVKHGIPVFIHQTMRGFHFLSVQPLTKLLYYELMKPIKSLNPKCPHVTLRIKPNKWVGERKVWNESSIIGTTFNKELADLRENMKREYYDKIKMNYRVVTYRQAGARGDL